MTELNETNRRFYWKAQFAGLACIINACILERQRIDDAKPIVLVIMFAVISRMTGWLIIAPFFSRTERSTKTRFFLADMYVLVAQLALVALPLFKLSGPEVAVSIALLISSWWWLGLKILARNGITQASVRFEVLAQTVPMAYGCAPAVICFAVLKFAGVWTVLIHAPSYVRPLNYVLLTLFAGIWFLFFIGSTWGSRLSMRRAISQATEGRGREALSAANGPSTVDVRPTKP